MIFLQIYKYSQLILYWYENTINVAFYLEIHTYIRFSSIFLFIYFSSVLAFLHIKLVAKFAAELHVFE